MLQAEKRPATRIYCLLPVLNTPKILEKCLSTSDSSDKRTAQFTMELDDLEFTPLLIAASAKPDEAWFDVMLALGADTSRTD